jgi:hypothetical protein
MGRSGRGRKGDAVSLITRIDNALRQLDEPAVPQVHRGGLSSREGLVHLIHDTYKDGKTEVAAVEDKRLWVVESEFANVLHQGKREGNTLSSALRDCWDGVSLKPATKSNRVHATDPHMCLSGAVTPSELLSLMASRELTNGFANRFLVIWAERQQLLPFPQATPQMEVDAMASRVLDVLSYCNASRWVDSNHLRVGLTLRSKELYEFLYLGELNDQSAGERINALIERRAPMLLRIAMLFALTDKTSLIETHHLEAALAWVRYYVDSIRYIFASVEDEVQMAKTNDDAEKIVAFLKEWTVATRSDLSKRCFQGHASKDAIDGALDELLHSSPPRISVESRARPAGKPGSAIRVYRLGDCPAERSAKSAIRVGMSGPKRVPNPGETCETKAPKPKMKAVLRTIRSEASGQDRVEESVKAHISQTSHDSQDTEIF